MDKLALLLAATIVFMVGCAEIGNTSPEVNVSVSAPEVTAEVDVPEVNVPEVELQKVEVQEIE